MKKIHRFYEVISDNEGLLHDVCYTIDSKNKVLIQSLQSHTVIDGIVKDKMISHSDPLQKSTLVASYSILANDGVIDMDANYLL